MSQPTPGQPPPRRAGGIFERSRGRIIAWLVPGASAWLLAAMLSARPAFSDEGPGLIDRARPPRPAAPPWFRSDPARAGSTSPGEGWSGMACLALVLVGCGGIAVLARRMAPRATAGAVQVVGRVG